MLSTMFWLSGGLQGGSREKHERNEKQREKTSFHDGKDGAVLHIPYFLLKHLPVYVIQTIISSSNLLKLKSYSSRTVGNWHQ